MVKAQAKSCPDVVVAPQAKEYLSVKNTSLKYRTDWYSCRPAPEGCAPTTEWKEHFMKEFDIARASLRKRCKQIQESKATLDLETREQSRLKPTVKNEQSQIPRSNSPDGSTRVSPLSIAELANLTIPNMFDEHGWRALLYGSTPARSVTLQETKSEELTVKNSESVQSNMMAMSTSASVIASESKSQEVKLETGESSSEAVIPAEARQKQGLVPQPHFLARLNQGHLIQLLKYHLRWVAEDDINDDQGRWLYAIFLKLDPLVESDQVAVLRNLAKKCARIRSHLERESGSKVASVNMVITIVSRLFGQSDLE
ncbi:gem (nuclear organelle) associated protein 2 [Mortierella sp. AM989]|nr:gem (nuclear organelle) associated protein 2 [Mortierella sp. AM989]